MTNLERMKHAAANKPAVTPKVKKPSAEQRTAEVGKNVEGKKDKGKTKGEAKPPQPPQQPRKKHKHRPLPLTPDERDQLFKRRHRLPHGAHFEATYDADAVIWKGTLILSGEPNEEGRTWHTFNHSGPGLYRMLSELDDLYLATLKPQSGGTTSAPNVTLQEIVLPEKTEKEGEVPNG